MVDYGRAAVDTTGRISGGRHRKSEISCFHPGCTDPADEKANDEKFGAFVAFCEDHVDEWRDTEHIDFDPYTEPKP